MSQGHIDSESHWVAAQFYFSVTIDGVVLSCKEVSGLETTNKVIEYRHGDNESFIVQKRIGMTETSNLKVIKGVFEDDDHFLELFNRVYDKEYMMSSGRMDILIELYNEHGDAIMVWNFHNCIPTKLGGVSLKSDANEAAIEELEFVYENLLTSL
jgi:phage tail-like protein